MVTSAPVEKAEGLSAFPEAVPFLPVVGDESEGLLPFLSGLAFTLGRPYLGGLPLLLRPHFAALALRCLPLLLPGVSAGVPPFAGCGVFVVIKYPWYYIMYLIF